MTSFAACRAGSNTRTVLGQDSHATGPNANTMYIIIQNTRLWGASFFTVHLLAGPGTVLNAAALSEKTELPTQPAVFEARP